MNYTTNDPQLTTEHYSVVFFSATGSEGRGSWEDGAAASSGKTVAPKAGPSAVADGCGLSVVCSFVCSFAMAVCRGRTFTFFPSRTPCAMRRLCTVPEACAPLESQ